MTADEAIEIARSYSSEQGWPWQPPVTCKKRGGWLSSSRWEVRSNSEMRGCNVLIVVDDATERVTRANLLPR